MSSIAVDNLLEDEVLSYPLVLLEGHVRNVHPTETLFLEARLDALRSSLWPISSSSGHFKAFVLLPSPGKFAITLRAPGAIERIFCIEYRPPTTRYVVKFHYQTCSDSGIRDGFDAPPNVDNSDAAAIAKVRFNALLLQMATAELLHAAGLPRETFAMQFAADGLPDVQLLRCSFTNAHARSVDGQKLIKLVERDIEAAGLDDHPELEFKHAVVLGCSRYNTKTRKAEGHTALGGGKVGVFGSCGLHAWPAHLSEISACCLNNARIDERFLLDDSCFRGTLWANFSTGIGAMLHEIGHTFGLGHATSGIMSRGFDDMNRLLCIYQADPRSSQMGFHQASAQGWLGLNHAVLREVTSRGGAHWNSASAQLLRHCPWISGHAKPSLVGPTVSWDDSVRGPVGNGQFNGTQLDLPENKPSMSGADEIGAVMVDAGKYVNRLETLTRAQINTGSFWLLESASLAWMSVPWHGSTAFSSTRTFAPRAGLVEPEANCMRCKLLTGGELARSLDREVIPGKALEHGPKTPFSVTLPAIGAVVIRCGRFVESIRILSPEEAAANAKDPKFYRSNEHVFQLVSGEKLVKLESFESAQMFDELVNQLHATFLEIGSPYQVHCVPLATGEKLVQIDISIRPVSASDPYVTIDGVCFHTTTRCSSWFGEYRESNVRFFMAPSGTSVLQLRGAYTNSVLTDLTGVVWRVPHKMLEDHIDSADRKKTLFEEYIVGAISSGGAYSKTAAPVHP
uniref:Jacalin-type lectin domain-containing protein n=1 Tax=Phytophthora ramorum TaxID=164328 RepID=H3HEH0_PHYRM